MRSPPPRSHVGPTLNRGACLENLHNEKTRGNANDLSSVVRYGVGRVECWGDINSFSDEWSHDVPVTSAAHSTNAVVSRYTTHTYDDYGVVKRR